MTRTPLSRSKGQGHQAALLTTVLARQAAAAVGVGTCGHGKLLLRCRLLDGARRFGAHGEEERAGAYSGAAARPQLVIISDFAPHLQDPLAVSRASAALL